MLVVKTKALICSLVTEKLSCDFVLAYAKKLMMQFILFQ